MHKKIWQLIKEKGKTPVIILDEAHLLCREMLEEIRFLLNFKMDSYNPLSLIFVRQMELKRKAIENAYPDLIDRVVRK